MTATSARRTSPAPDPAWRPEMNVNRRNTTLRRAVAALAGRTGRVLEVGAGTARFLRAVHRFHPHLQAHASDIDPAALRQAVGASPLLEVTQSDLTALPYRDGAFDAVLVFDVLEHLHQPALGVAEIARVTKPGGVLHALIPCEGQPLTLHWLLWKAGVASDLKERRVGHVQRFTHASAVRLLQTHGFRVTGVSWSMHPVGQVKDVLTYLEMEAGFPRWLARNPLYRGGMAALWLGSYAEAAVLQRLPLSAVAMHVTAVRQ